MPQASLNSNIAPAWLMAVARYRALLVPIAFVAMLTVVVVPLPPMMMDLLVATNIAVAAVILLTTIYVKSPLDFSVFPSLLLGTTLMLPLLSTGLFDPKTVPDTENEVVPLIASGAVSVAVNEVVMLSPT